MTTTHTFHGLNTESRSSSRVLNPPGGSSSNIFGGCDNQLKQSCARNNPEMMSREKSDNVGHGLPEKTTGSQQKSWAPRSGDGSIHTSFGIYPSSGCDKAPSNIRVSLLIPGVECPKNMSVERLICRSTHNKADTFKTIFGEDKVVKYRKMFRRVHNVSDDSFSRVFGQGSVHDEINQRCRNAAPTASFLSVNSVKRDISSTKSGDGKNLPLHFSDSVYTNFGSKIERPDKASSAAKIFRSNASLTRTVPLFRRFPLSSAFNPITGEVYEQPKTRSVTGVPSSESGASKSFPVGASQQPSGISNAVSVDKIQSELVQPAAAVVPSAAAVVQPAAAVVPSAATVVQPAEVQPVAAEVQPTAVVEIHAEEKPQASQSGRMFGESVEDTKPHRSTRVSQPPGGHSSKLW